MITIVALAGSLLASQDSWKPADNPLMTRWARDVSPESVHPEYPRPQMVRKAWTNLNGLWDYAILPRDAGPPEKYDGKILVPFPVESALSGVKKTVGPDKRLWYRRTFAAPKGDRLLLHFGAVDWRAEVWVNGKGVGEHKGGYDSFTFDITDHLREGEQELVVAVWDPTNAGFQPRGKQVAKPRGIWYTSVTGIWQTVWLEPVPETRIRGIRMEPDADRGVLRLTVDVAGALPVTVHAEARDGDRVVGKVSLGTAGKPFDLAIEDPKLWSPDSPHLYDLKVVLMAGGNVADAVESYFGLRKIEIRKGPNGFNRLFLNSQPLFQFGPLDQGWWPDGLYTPPTDAALRHDIEVTKKLGFNMLRKHVKVEPARFYTHCDRLGMLVWQDMPNGDRHIRRNQPDMKRSPESAENFRREYRALIDAHFNHPSIVVWVPFNEGWGQFETDAVLEWTKKYDPTRLVDGPSGWADRGTGDIHDMHRYPGPAMPDPEDKRAVVLGEFGGLGLPMEKHLWWNKRNWGYRTYKTKEELRSHYDGLIRRLRPLIGSGLAAAIYTQTTDVEGEVNGLMTYDREVVKFDPAHLARLHAPLYKPQPKRIVKVIVPASRKKGQTWRYATSKPADGWEKPDFDDTGWKAGPGGFGRADTPGAVVRTPWKGKQIWLRRTFELKDPSVENPHLRILHDEDAEVYVNGTRVAAMKGYTSRYVDLPFEAPAEFRAGRNTIAVHCRQTIGGQYIDVGILEVREEEVRK